VALFRPKGKRNRENKLNLNEGTILCLLDNGAVDRYEKSLLGPIKAYKIVNGRVKTGQ